MPRHGPLRSVWLLGFAKTADHNREILRRLPEYLDLGAPLLVGASRKSFLQPDDGEGTGARLEGTLAVSVLAILGGASVLRVHDVRENRRAVRVTEGILAAPRPKSRQPCGTPSCARFPRCPA